ncbi:MAG: alkaline phosphatase [Steroidobacteraceae bacterium]|nr:alkaline phosphatase [Steroidobacteraceae bacterium]
MHRPSRASKFATTIALAVGLAVAGTASGADDDDKDLPGARFFPPGNVIFFHPDGTAANHWGIARMYYKGLDGSLNWDRMRHMAFYRGHMGNVINGTSNGGATTHAFGYKVDGLGSFGKDGDGDLTVPTDKFIFGLSGFGGSIMREAANAGIPVGVVNDGHIGEPGTGVFLAEVGNRNDWQEITRQMIQGRPGKRDVDPWVILGGGEADTLPKGATLLHRNVNQERGAAAPNGNVSLREDDLNLQAEWNARGRGDLSNDPLRFDDYVVLRTRAEFERLRTALAANPRYAPHVLGLFAFQDLFNDRNEQDLINRGFVRAGAPANAVLPGKASRLVLRGDFDPAQPGFNPPTFAEMTQVAITVLDRAARQQQRPEARRFLLVGEPESNDNFGNNDNAIGLLESMRDTDDAIGIALDFVRQRPRTLVLTAADSDAGGMQVISPNVSGNPAGTPQTNVLAAGRAPDVAGTVGVNPSSTPLVGTTPASTAVNSFVDGIEGRQSPLFVTEPDQFGQRMQFGVVWPGTGDYSGGILSRAAGWNARLLNTTFSERFDNVDVYRMMHLTLFGRLLPYPQAERAPVRPE